ncbi:MAG: hypothetical protein AB4041_08900 [Microcystaceae cyanobacterium]
MKIKTLIAALIISSVSFFSLKTLINQTVFAQTSNEIRELNNVKVPVVLPNYIPSGFRQTKFEFSIDKNNNYGDYEAIYQGPNNTCFEIWADNRPGGGYVEAIREWEVNINVNTKSGTLILKEAGNPDGTKYLIVEDVILGNEANEEGALFQFDSPTDAFQCNQVSVQEAIKILESLQYKNP